MLERVDGLFVLDSPVVTSSAAKVAESARTHRLPTMSGLFATAGGLLSYGANNPDIARRAAHHVDKILRNYLT